ncbi:MAG TPA: group II intron maturase-specific domain-containing protein [Nitrospirota bacterium]|nr:group II intron maturase-specific domain-containing protein [Nitrospirota bacterium]
MAKLDVSINEEKTRLVALTKEDSFSFLGFDIRRVRTLSKKWGILITPWVKARTNLLRSMKEVFRRFISQPVHRLIDLINPKLRGWVNYFRIGHSSRHFQYIKDWVEKKIRRHLMRARKRAGFGWNRWSRIWLYKNLGLYSDYNVRYYGLESAASK